MKNVLEYLEFSVERHPDKVAVADENVHYTYRELYEKARRIGSGLGSYTKPGCPIVVCMEKSCMTLAAFMGILYSGCFYILLDPAQPKGRIHQILETLEAKIILTDEEHRKYLDQETCTILDIYTLSENSCNDSLLQDIRRGMLDRDPMYVIFTSGSTGVPKGVIVSHGSVIDFIDHFTELFQITGEDVIGNQAPFDFDVSVKDIYSSLKVGARLEIIPRRLFSFPVKLLDYLCERQVTTLIWAVSALCIVTTLHGLEYRVPEKINKILFSGEVMPASHLNIWREYLPHARFVNLYGPTEITCNCTYYEISKECPVGEKIPIGEAFPNKRVILLDDKDQSITEPGKIGELCVLGTGLALGYYHNPEQTQKVFVQNPLNANYREPMYRSGDLAYRNPDGLLVFAGRKDFQIKHMGHRIELGEIELAMDKIPGILRNCCIYDAENNKIVVFYEGDTEKKNIVKALKIFLPMYMLPNVYYPMERLPVTEHGKINRKQLQETYQEVSK